MSESLVDGRERVSRRQPFLPSRRSVLTFLGLSALLMGAYPQDGPVRPAERKNVSLVSKARQILHLYVQRPYMFNALKSRDRA